jgi:hypothetical protein
LTNPKKDDIINKMRKLSLRILCYAILSVVLILGACIKPVGVDDFLRDSRVQDIVGGTEGVKINPEYDHPDDLKPVLNDGDLDEGDTVTIRISIPDIVIITVSNVAEAGYNDIEWYCGDTGPLTAGVSANKESLAITAGSAPFEKGMHQLTVIGTTNGTPYSTKILIEVED